MREVSGVQLKESDMGILVCREVSGVQLKESDRGILVCERSEWCAAEGK